MQHDEVLQLAEQSEKIVRNSAPVSVPVMLMITCVSTAFYVTFLADFSMSWLKSFMGMQVLQMVPLVALKLKIWMCPDRLSLTPMLLVKTLLMHLFLCAVRCFTSDGFRVYLDPLALMAGLAILHKSFGFKPADVAKHRDIGAIVVVCFVLAFGTSFLKLNTNNYGLEMTQRGLRQIMDHAGNYADVFAFVPVAMLVCHESGVENFTPGTAIPTETKWRALYFFSFIVSFYLMEDIIEPMIHLDMYGRMRSFKNYEMCVVAHVAHFVMLLDFVGYFFFKIWFPSAEKVASFQVKSEGKGLLSMDADEEDMEAI